MVGCIVHRDMQLKNIPLTHDYKPLVVDFGLVSLHTEQDTCNDEGRVIGREPITEKVGIYTFWICIAESNHMYENQGTTMLQGAQYLASYLCITRNGIGTSFS